jgi:hypothetical protein
MSGATAEPAEATARTTIRTMNATKAASATMKIVGMGTGYPPKRRATACRSGGGGLDRLRVPLCW